MNAITRRAALGGLALLPGGAGIAAANVPATPDGQVLVTAEHLDNILRVAFLLGQMNPDDRSLAIALIKEKSRSKRAEDASI
jgi:hypothetical protein